jgi:hypothetical protein
MDNKHFNTWNCGFDATAFMHHTQFVLDGDFVPLTLTEVGLFREMKIFMYAALGEKLKPDGGKSLVSACESKRNAQSIHKELTKHAKSSTAAQLSGDILLKYITGTQYPGNCCGTSYTFDLIWKEQVMDYKKLELEHVPPKQKLRILNNTVSGVADLSNVKQLSDQVVTRGLTHLGFKEYLELLLSACSTYDKTHATPRFGQRNVHAANLTQGDDFYNAHDCYTYGVDTDVTNILAHTSTM